MSKVNLLINDIAKLRHAIYSKYAEHWYAGLRQAVIEIKQIEDRLSPSTIQGRIARWLTPKHQIQELNLLHQEALHIEQQIINNHHQEIADYGYEELQRRYAEESFERRQMFVIAADMMCQRYGISQSSAELLLANSGNPEKQQSILTGALKLNGDLAESIIQVAMRELPPERRQSIALQSQQIELEHRYLELS